MTRSKRETPYHRTQMDTATKRRARILKLVADGYSYSQIGDMLDPKVTRQRIGQIVRALRSP